jgi:hypothetical protein
MDWVVLLRQLPKSLLMWGGVLACLAFLALVGATLDSNYRTHKPFRVAGFLFGYAGDDPPEAAHLKQAINDQFRKLAQGVVDDLDGKASNSSPKTELATTFPKSAMSTAKERSGRWHIAAGQQ